MPDGTLTVDRGAVRVLATAVGVREAARQLGLSQCRVLQWSKRGNWFKTPPLPQPPTVTRNHVTTVISPAESLKNQLEDDSRVTRLGLSKAAKAAAETFSKANGQSVIKQAKQLRDITSTASTLHGWEERTAGGALNLNLGIVLGGMVEE